MRDDKAPANNEINPMVTYVNKEFERYEKFHRERFEDYVEIYDYWTGEPPARSYGWQNAVHVPMTVEAEQTVTPRIFGALFPSEAPVECQVFDPATPEQGIIIRDMIKKQFQMTDVQGEAFQALTQNTLFGTGYVEATWLIDRKWMVTPEGDRYQAIVANRNDCKAVNFFEIYPHPSKLRMDDTLPLIRRRFCDAEYLKKLSENPKNGLKNISAALQSKPVFSHPSIILDEVGNAMMLEDKEKYELLEYWGPWDVSFEKDGKVVTKKAVPYWISVINRTVVIRDTYNPYNHQRPPFCKLNLYRNPNPSWFGVGIGKIGKPTQERINKIVNQRLDNVDLVMNKQGFYNGNDTLINTKKLQISKPGQWHKVSDTSTSIRWMDIPDVTTSSYKEEEIAKNDFRESTGATVPLMPADQGQHRTAMGISLLQGAAGERFRPVLRKLETDFIQDLATMFLSNLQQFMVVPEWVMVTGSYGKAEPIEITPEQIQGKVLFIPTGVSETLNKEAQIGQLMRFKELTVNDPTINRVEINKRMAELLGFKDIQALLTPPQVPPQQAGGLNPDEQQRIQQRIAEGATPDQIRMEMLGQPPAPEQVEQGQDMGQGMGA